MAGSTFGASGYCGEFRSETARIDSTRRQSNCYCCFAIGEHRDRAEIKHRIVTANGPDAQDPKARLSRGTLRLDRGATMPASRRRCVIAAVCCGTRIAVRHRYSGPQINVFDAAPEVIAALPGMTPERLDAVLKQRQALPRNEDALLPLLGAAQQFSTTEGGNAIRVNVRIVFDSGRRTNSEVIILVFEAGDKPYAVLSWSEEQIERRMNNVKWAGSR
jgi:hypothetical protein